LASRKDHRCDWRDRAEALDAELKQTRSELEQLQQKTTLLDERLASLNDKVFGRSSERQRIHPVDDDVRKRRPIDREQVRRKRKATADAKANVETDDTKSAPAPEACHCEYCNDGPEDFTVIGRKTSTVFVMRPAKLVRNRCERITLSCHCGKTIVTGAPPQRFGRSQYDSSVVAHLVTGKCTDSLPVARQAEQLRRQGLPANRATLNRVFLRAGRLLSPLVNYILGRIAASDLVHGDETPMRQQDQSSKGYFWTFNTDEFIAYVYSPNRSGDTPRNVLAGTRGHLVVDGYTGYNSVTTPEGRIRAGCNAHARRKFCEALPNTPAAQHAIDLYTEVFLVEHDAAQLGIVGTNEHLQMRKQRSAPAMDQLREWLLEQKPLHLPKGKMGEAMGYALNNWAALSRFLSNAKIPVSNNRSERLLRVVAQGRKNYLSVGHENAGQSIANLYTLTASCKAAGVDPIAYFTDVLARLDRDPACQVEELLPRNWRQLDSS
jgi:transposase